MIQIKHGVLSQGITSFTARITTRISRADVCVASVLDAQYIEYPDDHSVHLIPSRNAPWNELHVTWRKDLGLLNVPFVFSISGDGIIFPRCL